MRLAGDVKTWYFSVKHKLHHLDPFWYGLAWSITDHCMVGFLMPFLFISQKCLDNYVEFALLRLENNYHGKYKIVNFLDVTFNLCTGKCQPYKKPNDTPTYINVNSNHPPNIIKELSNSISKRISNISSDKAAFNRAAPSYNDVLSASG